MMMACWVLTVPQCAKDGEYLIAFSHCNNCEVRVTAVMSEDRPVEAETSHVRPASW